MNVFINNVATEVPKEVLTLEDLVRWKNINPQGTAIALNDKLIKQNLWNLTTIKELDQITIISAAFGG